MLTTPSNDSAPQNIPTPTPAAPVNKVTVRQVKLSSEGPTTVTLSNDADVLDIHLIDGEFYLRTLEPVDTDPEDTSDLTIVPAAVGTVLSVQEGRLLSPIAVRHSGIHFFGIR